MIIAVLALTGTAEAILDSRVCTHRSGARYEGGWMHGGMHPGPGAVVSIERWWLGGELLGERVVRYLSESPEPTLLVEWAEQPGAQPQGMGFETLTYEHRVTLSRLDGAPLHPELGERVTLKMQCTDVHTPPRP